jgi:hypothetical protein
LYCVQFAGSSASLRTAKDDKKELHTAKDDRERGKSAKDDKGVWTVTVCPGVVFVRDGAARLVVRRETYADLMRCDVES